MRLPRPSHEAYTGDAMPEVPAPQGGGAPGVACRLVQLTAGRTNAAESLEGERGARQQLRASIAELAEDALATKVASLIPSFLPASPSARTHTPRTA